MPPPRDHEEDLRLVARCNAGDAAAFDELVGRHGAWAQGVALRFTGDAEAAADAVQEAFLYLLRKFPGFELRARLTTFLYPVLKHEAQAQRRKAGRFASDEAALEAAPDRGEGSASEDAEQLRAALVGLPEAQREVLLMRYAHGMSEEEIARALEVPPGTVKSRAHHALKALRSDPRARAWFEDSRSS